MVPCVRYTVLLDGLRPSRRGGVDDGCTTGALATKRSRKEHSAGRVQAVQGMSDFFRPNESPTACLRSS